MTAEPDRGSDGHDKDAIDLAEGSLISAPGAGPYPNPHSDNSAESHDFDGGQSGRAYYGGKQLGDRKLGDQANAPLEEE